MLYQTSLGLYTYAFTGLYNTLLWLWVTFIGVAITFPCGVVPDRNTVHFKACFKGFPIKHNELMQALDSRSPWAGVTHTSYGLEPVHIAGLQHLRVSEGPARQQRLEEVSVLLGQRGEGEPVHSGVGRSAGRGAGEASAWTQPNKRGVGPHSRGGGGGPVKQAPRSATIEHCRHGNPSVYRVGILVSF